MLLAGKVHEGLADCQSIANHVMNIHMNRHTENEVVGEIDIEKMKRYISYCKS